MAESNLNATWSVGFVAVAVHAGAGVTGLPFKASWARSGDGLNLPHTWRTVQALQPRQTAQWADTPPKEGQYISVAWRVRSQSGQVQAGLGAGKVEGSRSFGSGMSWGNAVGSRTCTSVSGAWEQACFEAVGAVVGLPGVQGSTALVGCGLGLLLLGGGVARDGEK